VAGYLAFTGDCGRGGYWTGRPQLHTYHFLLYITPHRAPNRTCGHDGRNPCLPLYQGVCITSPRRSTWRAGYRRRQHLTPAAQARRLLARCCAPLLLRIARAQPHLPRRSATTTSLAARRCRAAACWACTQRVYNPPILYLPPRSPPIHFYLTPIRLYATSSTTPYHWVCLASVTPLAQPRTLRVDHVAACSRVVT